MSVSSGQRRKEAVEMDGPMSPAKLTRTLSSLLRSSPTIRPSIHSLSSVTEEDLIAAQNDDVEAQKRRNHNPHFKPPVRPGPTWFSLLPLALLSLLTLLFLLRRDELSSSETLLSALVFIAITLFPTSKNKSLIRRSLAAVRLTPIWRRGGSPGSSKLGPVLPGRRSGSSARAWSSTATATSTRRRGTVGSTTSSLTIYL